MSALDVKRVLARNTIWNYVGFAVNLATNLVMFPFVVYRIGDAASGVWLLLSAVTGYMGLLELGIVPSLTQAIAASRGRGEPDAVSRVSSSAQVTLFGLATISLLLLTAIGPLTRALAIPAELEDQALLAFKIAIVGFALRMPLATYQGILLGHQRQDRCNQLWIAVGLAKFAAAAAVLTAGAGLVGLVTAEMVVHLLAGVLQVRWVRAEAPDLRLSWRLATRADMQRLLSFGGAILAVSICSLVIEQTDRLVIAAFLPVAMVTHYAAAWKIYMLSFTLTTTLVQALSPVAADLHGRGDGQAVRELFLRTTKFTAAVAWSLVFTLSLAGGFLLRVWMGDRFVDALPVVQVLLVAFAITAHNHAGYSALIGMRRVGPTVIRYFAPQAVLNLVLSVWLVQRLGNVGVALGTLIPAVALQFSYMRFVLGELGVPGRDFMLRAVRPAAVPAFIAYSPLVGAYLALPADSPWLLLGAVACTVLYAAIGWKFLETDERATILAQMPLRSSRTQGVRLPSAAPASDTSV